MRRLVIGLLLLSGCTLFDDDPPSRTCQSNQDCFVAQGETCNMTTHECEAASEGPDGGAP